MTIPFRHGIFADMEKNPLNPQILSEQIHRAQKELAILYEVSNAMRTTLELNHVLYIILTSVTAHTGLGFNRALLFLINLKERCLEAKMAIGPESGEEAQRIWNYISSSNQGLDDLIKEENLTQDINQTPLLKSVKNLKIPLGVDEKNLLSTAFHDGKPFHIGPDKIGHYFSDPLLQIFKTNELVIMPLKAKDKVNGLIIADNLYTQKPITSEDLKIFMMLANQAGLAIENSQLYEMVREKSHTDSITGLWNHGFFQDQLMEELSKAKEKNETLSLIILDIDNFKKFNDTHGHQNGDLVLKEVAVILKECCRENDFACRYGGEEFAIILTQTKKETALTIAERIREKISKYSFSVLSSQPCSNITVSVGLAIFPDDAQAKEELITKADQAMYIAKFSGKNQTCLAKN